MSRSKTTATTDMICFVLLWTVISVIMLAANKKVHAFTIIPQTVTAVTRPLSSSLPKGIISKYELVRKKHTIISKLGMKEIMKEPNENDNDNEIESKSKDELQKEFKVNCNNIHKHMNRRKALSLSSMSITTTLLSLPSPSSAATTTTTTTLDETSRRFRRVPTFALVDGATGVPFLILRNTGNACGYFFTTYEGARLVLDDARRDAKGKDLETTSMWENARIAAVPLEFALKLSKARPKWKAQNGVKYGTVFDVIPSVSDLDDAGRIDKSGLYTEQGRVPLFYTTSLEFPPETEGGEKRIPVFFQKADLAMAWKKQHPNDDETLPQVQVMDLVDTFSSMLLMGNDGGGSMSTNNDDNSRLLRNLVLIPSLASRKAAVESEKSRGSSPAYQTGEMIAVGGK